MSKIIKLQAENFKRLKAVEISPDGNLVIIAGKNGQGKSSILDAITAALGGVSAKTTPRPIRDGESNAQIVLETEDLIVTRKFTASGSTLTVKSPDGATYPKGQAKLDDLLGKLSLDPLAFTQLSDRDQLATLLDLVDLPFDPVKLDAERKEVFDRRTDVNRRVKELAAQAGGYGTTEPVEEVSVSGLLSEYREGQETARYQQKNLDVRASVNAEIDRINAKIGELMRDRRAQETRGDAVDVAIAAHKPLPDLDAIQQQIDGAEETNAKAREYADYKRTKEQHAAAKSSVDKLTEELATIDAFKAEGLAAASFPVEGLAFDEGGVIYQGVPFKQASSAEQLRVSLAMAMALNPKLKVIRIADGSLLDADNLALINDMATDNDYQVWLEVVSDGEGTGIIIEDGAIQS